MAEKNQKKRKTVIIIAIVLVGIAILSAVGILLLDTVDLPDREPIETLPTHPVPLERVDYDFDIFTDPEYTDLLRDPKVLDVYYSDGAVEMLISENYADYGEAFAFLVEYIEALRHGDTDALNACYAADWKKENGTFKRISMQRIYDVHLTDCGSIEEAGKVTYYFQVAFKIQYNDGTYRKDIMSDGFKPQFFEIVSDASGIRITDVQNTFIW